MPLNCPDIQSRMSDLQKLKHDFDIAYTKALSTKEPTDLNKAQSLKRQYQDSLEAIKQPLFLHALETETLLDSHVFDEYIARDIKEIDERTRVYIGPLKKNLFKHLPPTIDYIYLDYPEIRIYREDLKIGGHTVEDLKQMLKEQGCGINDWADDILNTLTFEYSLYFDPPNCTKLKQSEILNLIHITVADLGFPDGATTKQIFDCAKELGLSFCPPSVGPYYRLQYTAQLAGEWRIIGMNPINVAGGGPRFFQVSCSTDARWLRTDRDRPDDIWPSDSPIVFCVRPAKLDP